MSLTFFFADRHSVDAPVSTAVPHLSRPRLLQQLNASDDVPARLIQAPSGFGKTQLLREWASQHEGEVVWLALPVDGSVAEHLSILHDVRSQPVTGDAFVIDGLKHLDAAEMQQEIASLLSRFACSRVLLATSELRPMPESLGLHRVLSQRDLAFTDDEIAELARFWSVPGGDDTAAKLGRLSAAWPRGVRNALEWAHHADASGWNDTGDYTQEVVRRLAGELLEGPAGRQLALAAIPGRVLPSQARALGLEPEFASVLGDVERAGLGWWDYWGAEPSFEFQPMLREYLLRSAEAESLQAARSGLARWHLEHGLIRDAFAEAVRAQDWHIAHDCAQRDLVEVTAHLSDDPALLAKVPKSVLRREPLLNMLYALSLYISGRSTGALVAFGTLVVDVERKRLIRRSETHPDQVWVQGLLTLGLRLLGRYELVGASLRRFQSMIETVTDHSSALDSAEDLFFTEAAVTALYLGDIAWALEFLDRRPLRELRTKRQHFYGDALYLLALVLNGDMVRARERRSALLSQVLPPGFSESFYAIPLHIASAYLALEDGDAEQASESLALTEAHWETTENWPLLLLAHTDVAWIREDALTALEVFMLRRGQQRHRASISSAMEARLSATRAKLFAAAGRLAEAQKIVPARSKSSVLATTRALLLTRGGSYESAAEVVEQMLAEPNMTPRTQVESHVIGAIAAHRLGDERRARRHVFALESTVSRYGLRSPFALMPGQERDVLLADSPALLELAQSQPTYFEAPTEQPRLTKKERVMLYELNLGSTMSEAAQKHSVSLNTIKSQRRALYRKLGVASASEALDRARELGII